MSRREGFQKDVSSCRQTPEKLAAVGRLEVEGHPAFGRIVVPEGQTAVGVRDVVEEWPNATGGLATWRLDLDHVGPEIAEKLAAELTFLIGEFQNSQASQRTRLVLGFRHCCISSK